MIELPIRRSCRPGHRGPSDPSRRRGASIPAGVVVPQLLTGPAWCPPNSVAAALSWSALAVGECALNVSPAAEKRGRDPHRWRGLSTRGTLASFLKRSLTIVACLQCDASASDGADSQAARGMACEELDRR